MAQPVYKDTSNSARMAVIYITVGALMVVWTGISSLYLMRHGPVRDSTWYWDLGFFLTGLTLVGIGFGLGRIGRTARQADAGEHPVVTNPAPPVAVAVTPPRAPEEQVMPNGGPPPPQNSSPQVTA